jgi:beta-glucanase (GH16 family)
MNASSMRTSRALCCGGSLVLAGIVASTTLAKERQAPPGWRLVWSDEFDEFDEAKWEPSSSLKPTNNSLHAYRPEQVSVRDGKLVLLSENKPFGGLPYSSGLVKSKYARKLGRWEVRAKLPTTRGMWPAIWLLPDARWPGKGEIDFMESRGNEPTITSCAFHWGTTEPYFHDYHDVAQRQAIAGRLVDYSQGFHDYAVDWFADQLRFYVDDVHHATFYNDELGDFLPKLSEPMRLILNTAIGGDFLPPPDETTRWPQEMQIDWVRIYESTGDAAPAELANADFESRGGSLALWHVFGNRMKGEPNIQVQRQAVRGGKNSLRLNGQSSGEENYSGVAQGISARGGDRIRATVWALVCSEDRVGEAFRASLKLEFYNRRGEYYGGPAMLDAKEQPVADGSTPKDQWRQVTVEAVAPPGTVEARMSLVVRQQDDSPGAVYVDDVRMEKTGGEP